MFLLSLPAERPSFLFLLCKCDQEGGKYMWAHRVCSCRPELPPRGNYSGGELQSFDFSQASRCLMRHQTSSDECDDSLTFSVMKQSRDVMRPRRRHRCFASFVPVQPSRAVLHYISFHWDLKLSALQRTVILEPDIVQISRIKTENRKKEQKAFKTIKKKKELDSQRWYKGQMFF